MKTIKIKNKNIMKKIIIFGFGGQAKVVLDCIKLIKDYKVIGFISNRVS